jgi:hypothetical protein
MTEFSDSVAEVCTLPTADLPDRVSAFDDVFRRHLSSVERRGSTRTQFALDPRPSVAAVVADLAAREVQCCAFFDFALHLGDGSLALTVSVPDRFAPVLAAFTEHADAVLASAHHE